MIITSVVKTILRPSSLLILVVFIGLLVFLTAVPECRNVSSKNIVVVTGAAERIPRALEIMRLNPDARLLISGAGSHQLRLPPDMKIEIETTSKTTFENSLAIKSWVLENGFNDIALITSDYHMWRTMLLTRRQLPFTKIETCAVSPDGLTRRKRLELWMKEFGKYFMTIFGINEKAG